MRSPAWTVLYNIDNGRWIGTGWEFFDNENVAKSRSCELAGTVRPYNEQHDRSHLGAVHQGGKVSRRAFSTSIYLRHAGRILLVLHKRLGLWLPLGGELEPNETPLEGARRELEEESGIVDAVFHAPTYEEHDAGSKGLHMNFAFVADTNSEDVILCDEHLEHAWYTLEQVIQLGVPDNVLRIVATAIASPGSEWSTATDESLIVGARIAAGVAWRDVRNVEDQEPEVRRILRACAERIKSIREDCAQRAYKAAVVRCGEGYARAIAAEVRGDGR